MSKIVVSSSSLYIVDHEINEIKEVEIDSKSKFLSVYIERLKKDILNSKSRKEFSFPSETTEVVSSIYKMLEDDFFNSCKINAERLLRVETETKERMDKLGVAIQKGSLFQTIIDNSENSREKIVIIVKAEQFDFLDSKDFIVHNGLPWEKRVFKSFLAFIDKDNKIRQVLVSDTTSKLSKYWWSSFFELEEVRDDVHNTKRFLDLIESKVLNRLKKNYKEDYNHIRNGVLGYFRVQEEFDMENLIESVIDRYSPVNLKFPIKDIPEKIREIPKKNSLDTRFVIDKEGIKKRRVNSFELLAGVHLKITAIADMNNITAKEDDEDNKGIFIKTEIGYSEFK